MIGVDACERPRLVREKKLSLPQSERSEADVSRVDLVGRRVHAPCDHAKHMEQ